MRVCRSSRLDWSAAARRCIDNLLSGWHREAARFFVSGLVSDDLRLGFPAVNVALVTFGVWCYLWPVLRCWHSARAIALGWAVVELVDGVGHPLWSVRQGRYTSRVVTTPVLLDLAAVLAWQLRPATRRHVAGEYFEE